MHGGKGGSVEACIRNDNGDTFYLKSHALGLKQEQEGPPPPPSFSFTRKYGVRVELGDKQDIEILVITCCVRN